MKKLFIVSIIVAMSCGGKLSEEERKKLHDGMNSMDIKRVTDAELQMAALNYAQSVLKAVEEKDPLLASPGKTDSIAQSFGVEIYRLTPSDSALREIEKQLVEAYIAGGDAEHAGENLQELAGDSLLFTKPIFKENADGSQQFNYAIGIKMATKTVVLSMPKP